MTEIVLERFSKSYGSVRVLHEFDLTVREGEFVALLGPSGCGKSTLLRMIAGLEDITGGTLYIGGVPMNDRPARDRDIAMVFQNYALYPHMTVYDNMAFGLRRLGLGDDARRQDRGDEGRARRAGRIAQAGLQRARQRLRLPLHRLARHQPDPGTRRPRCATLSARRRVQHSPAEARLSAAASGQDLLLGVRPRDIQIADASAGDAIGGCFVLSEMMGAETLVQIMVGGQEISMLVDEPGHRHRRHAARDVQA